MSDYRKLARFISMAGSIIFLSTIKSAFLLSNTQMWIIYGWGVAVYILSAIEHSSRKDWQ